jgi:hypothetical protein
MMIHSITYLMVGKIRMNGEVGPLLNVRVKPSSFHPTHPFNCQLTSLAKIVSFCQLQLLVPVAGCTQSLDLSRCPYTGSAAAASAIANPSDLYALYLSFCLIMLNVFLFLKHFYCIFYVSF